MVFVIVKMNNYYLFNIGIVTPTGDMIPITYNAIGRTSTTGQNASVWFNLTRDASAIESKNYEHTTRDGHVKGYLINYENCWGC